MIDILIADDQGMIRTLLIGLCDAADDMRVVAQAESGEAAIGLVHAKRPHVALVDVKLPGISGFEVTRRLSRQVPQTHIIVLTAMEGASIAARAFAAGARGFLTKQAVVHELVRTIRKVHTGRCYVDAGLAQKVAIDHLRQGVNSVHQLSDREVDVLLLMLRGLTAAEISDTLSLAGKTVEHHRRSIRRKLDVATDAQLGVVAARYGFDPMIDGTTEFRL